MLASGSGGFKYALFVAAEEGLEMLGIWLLIYSLADYIKYRSYKPKISLIT